MNAEISQVKEGWYPKAAQLILLSQLINDFPKLCVRAGTR
jgi:hypothetical protein